MRILLALLVVVTIVGLLTCIVSSKTVNNQLTILAGPIYPEMQIVGPIGQQTTRQDIIAAFGQPFEPREEGLKPKHGYGDPVRTDYFGCIYADIGWFAIPKDRVAYITYNLEDFFNRYGIEMLAVVKTNSGQPIVLSRETSKTEVVDQELLKRLGISNSQVTIGQDVVFMKFGSGGVIEMRFDNSNKRLKYVNYRFTEP